ncbi:uncharacterized protein LOC117296806 isoform X2 [Asterias rubens]|uniref:uncharacterized protein LOC117296806 isoform X2 n=1 Tax=Asterias rubens TaxID=7604 RepID=UPI00145510C5|nr:uncharacterized protein LOC117296806 isoform X2 [Asterias rubens]
MATFAPYLSAYAENLDFVSRARYVGKIELVGGFCDPYIIPLDRMTSWGCDHERTAREAYFKVTASKHSSFSINDAGLFINPDTPFIGATPDGLVHCDCCGDGVLEVKCPYSKKDVPMETACADPSFYLSTSDQGTQLKENHQYYYQIQTQLHSTKRKYCDFVVWIPSQIHIQRIEFNANFFKCILEKVSSFYKVCILFEVIGKWFTQSRPLAVQDLSATFGNEGQPTVWCYCRRADLKAQFVSCYSDKCQIKKFHMSCVKLKVAPKRKWFCKDCRKEEE